MLGCRTLRLESQSSAGLRMQPCPLSPVLVWPGHLHGTGCLSAEAMDTGFPTFEWHLCLGLGSAVTPPILAGVLGVCVWVQVVVAPHNSWLGFVVCAVRLGGWFLPRHSWQGDWGVCGCVRASPVPRHSWLGCASRCVCLGSGFRCAPPLLAGLLGSVRVCVRTPLVPRHSWLGCAVWVCVLGLGFRLRPSTPG